MQKYQVEQILELSAKGVTPQQEVLDFCEEFQQVSDILAQREARKARKKLPKEVTDEDGWTSFVKHEDEATEEEAADDGFVPAASVKKSKNSGAATMKVKTSASKMTRGGNAADNNITISQTKAFNAFAALGGEDDEDDE